MDNKNRIACLIVIFLTVGICNVFSQMKSSSSTSENRKIKIFKSSKEQVLEFEVYKESEIFKLDIESKIIFGSLRIEVYDPTGKEQGRFSVKTMTNKDDKNTSQQAFEDLGIKNPSSESVTGKMDKLFFEPVVGKWNIKIFPKIAIGEINIVGVQSVN